MHNNSVLLFQKYVKPVLEDGMKVLEIGPDAFPSAYQNIAKDVSVACWDTLDFSAGPNAAYQKLTYTITNEYDFQIDSDLYDFVVSGQVIEHVRKPWRWIVELARITKPGGLIVTVGPVSWSYHEAPVDCWRIYPEGMKALYEEANIETIFSCFESLETPNHKRYIPGKSMEFQTQKRKIMYKIFGMLGLPVERSYDTVTIGRKK